jgi:hypothetical protein
MIIRNTISLSKFTRLKQMKSKITVSQLTKPKRKNRRRETREEAILRKVVKGRVGQSIKPRQLNNRKRRGVFHQKTTKSSNSKSS